MNRLLKSNLLNRLKASMTMSLQRRWELKLLNFFSSYRLPYLVLPLALSMLLCCFKAYAQVIECKVNAYTAYQYAVQHGHRFNCYVSSVGGRTVTSGAFLATPGGGGELRCAVAAPDAPPAVLRPINSLYGHFFSRQLAYNWIVSDISTNQGAETFDDATADNPWETPCNRLVCLRNIEYIGDQIQRRNLRLATITLSKERGSCDNVFAEAFGPRQNVVSTNIAEATKIIEVPWRDIAREGRLVGQCAGITWSPSDGGYFANNSGPFTAVLLGLESGNVDPDDVCVIGPSPSNFACQPSGIRARLTNGTALLANRSFVNRSYRYYLFNQSLVCNPGNSSRFGPEQRWCTNGVADTAPMPLAPGWTVENVALRVQENFVVARVPPVGATELMIEIATVGGEVTTSRQGAVRGSIRLRGPIDAVHWHEAFRTDAGCGPNLRRPAPIYVPLPSPQPSTDPSGAPVGAPCTENSQCASRQCAPSSNVAVKVCR